MMADSMQQPEPSVDGHGGENDAERSRIDGATVRHMLELATTWLERHVTVVNALNVFPVPDGDTGTNMHLTMRAAVEAVRRVADEGAGAVVRAAAQGAVLGARGNSGVILSQIVAGLSRGVGDTRSISSAEFARALAEGASNAYRAVTRPVEGTILTVARAAGDAAVECVTQARESVSTVLGAAMAGAHRAVQATPLQLPILKQAGVVDAGGEGYRLILEGMGFALRGEALPALGEVSLPVAAVQMLPDDGTISPEDDPLAGEWGYCTQFVIVAHDGADLSVEKVRDDLQVLAESTMVVGGDGFVRIHGHTEDPGSLLTRAVQFGRVQRISIEDMDAQAERWRMAAGRVAGGTEVQSSGVPPDLDAPLADVAIIAIAPGEGFASVFRGLGVSEVVFGGQTMNPSAQEILDAARRAHARTVIVLPNNGNVVLTAKQASAVAADTLGGDRRILVVGSRTVPQGIGAMMAMTFGADPEAIVSAMTGALTSVRTVEVTRAIRDVSINEIDVRVGDLLGLVDDEVVAAGTEIDEVAARSLELAGARTAELVTIYRGADVSDSDASRFSDAVQTRFPNLSVESMTGGQPHYDFIISVE